MAQQYMFKNDCEAEECLFRDTMNMNRIAQDIQNFTFTECEKILTDRELEKYIKLIPGPDYSTRKHMIIKWLRENPCMRTLDPQVLYQRFFLYKKAYGAFSLNERPIHERPLHNTSVRLKRSHNLTKEVINQAKADERLAEALQQETKKREEIIRIEPPLKIQPPKNQHRVAFSMCGPLWINPLKPKDGSESNLDSTK